MSVIMYFLSPILFIVVVIIIMMVVGRFFGKKKSKKATLMARVMSVRKSGTAYKVLFSTEDGEVLELDTPGSIAEVLSSGNRGKLTYQGQLLLSFIRDTV